MWHFTYILQNRKGNQYIGHSANLKIRLQQHNQGAVPATIDGRPWQIAWFCAFRSAGEAIKFERYLKSGSGGTFRFRHLVSKR